MRLLLDAPDGFSFHRTVHGHGWWTLAPFRVSEDGAALWTVVALHGGGAAGIELRAHPTGVSLTVPGRWNADRRRLLVAAARRVLNLDLDLAEFYRATAAHAGLEWVAGCGAGRLLRGATVFEDLVKLVLTTNCSWALTKRMVQGLVDRCGEAGSDGARAFPGAEAIARLSERELRETVRVGYRAPSLVRLSREVAAGRVRPETWEDPQVDPDDLRAELLELPGVGPYVAENLLRLLGKPAGPGLDSWIRARYAEIYHGGRRITDRTITRRYARLGRWSGLALWCDMTRDWFDPDGRNEWGVSPSW